MRSIHCRVVARCQAPPVAVAEGTHGFSGGNADRIEEEHFTKWRAGSLNGPCEGGLAAAGCAGEDDEGWSHAAGLTD